MNKVGFLKYFIFFAIYFYVTNWLQINIFVSSALKPKESVSIIQDDWISNVVKNKTGINLSKIIIFNTPRLFGLMPGIPWYPEMILSRGMYENFTKDELEWVVLHESGHCVMWHVAKSVVVEMLILVLGLWVVSRIGKKYQLYLIPLLALSFSLITIQIERYFEYEADYYSISRVDNPQGVITASEKLNNKKPYWFYKEGSITRELLFWNILPSQRIKMARERLR